MASSVNARVACDGDQGVFYKEFLPRGPLEALKALFRGSRATRARQQNDALLSAGFQAPTNLAWGKLPGVREYLFSTAVSGAGVTEWLREKLTQRSGDALLLRRELLCSLGSFIGRLHAAGFIHGDLRTSNVLAQRYKDEFNFSLIDNERNICKQPAPGRGMLRNLMQLNMLLPSDITRTDRMRFFIYWQREMTDLSPLEAKILGGRSYQWAMARLGAKNKL